MIDPKKKVQQRKTPESSTCRRVEEIKNSKRWARKKKVRKERVVEMKRGAAAATT